MIRITTNGVLKGYRANLMKSGSNLNAARNTVLSQRNFNSYAEDPAAASQAFKLRRAWWRAEQQVTNNETVLTKYQTAYSALDNVSEMVATKTEDIATALKSAMMGANDTAGSGRPALGQQLKETAKSIIQSMNGQYGDSFIFSGADGLNVPFSWDADGNLCFRNVPVDVAAGSEDHAKLDYLAGETLYVDLGLGLKELGGELVPSSAFDAALSGLDFLGYGVDDEGLPNNLASIVNELGQCLSRCDSQTGAWAPGDEERYGKLQNKFNAAFDHLTAQRTEQTASATFLKTNQKQLEDTAYNINEQLNSVERCDLADAITSFAWAQYCYNAALKIGNSILSQSLIDYMN